MNKYFILMLLACVYFAGHSQISIGASQTDTPSNLDAETFERFKSTTTIFVLSDVLSSSEYEQLLKDTWTVTPYKIISHDDFELSDMYKGNYSFATLTGFKDVDEEDTELPKSLQTYFDIAIYNAEEISKKLRKLSHNLPLKKRNKRIEKIFSSNQKTILKFFLFPSPDFVQTAITEEREEIEELMYNEEVFFNYTSGMLKNYLQKSNELLIGKARYWMYKKDFDVKKIARLATSNLFIPDYITQKTKGWNNGASDGDDKKIEKLFKRYDYNYELISKDNFDTAIADNKEFYYMRYGIINTERFIQIVNSKTGNIIYRDYITGVKNNQLKSKNLDQLCKTIAKSQKMLSK